MTINTYPPVNWTRLAAWNLKEALTFEVGSNTRRLFLEGAVSVISRHSRKVAVRDEALGLLAEMNRRDALKRIRLSTFAWPMF